MTEDHHNVDAARVERTPRPSPTLNEAACHYHLRLSIPPPFFRTEDNLAQLTETFKSTRKRVTMCLLSSFNCIRFVASSGRSWSSRRRRRLDDRFSIKQNVVLLIPRQIRRSSIAHDDDDDSCQRKSHHRCDLSTILMWSSK